MTAIAAVADGERVWIGGDSAGIDERLSLGVGIESKVWEAGPLLFGACGSFRVAQLLRWHMTMPMPSGEEPIEYLSGPLATAMRETLEVGGALSVWDADSTQEMADSAFVVGFQGRVFEVFGDFGIGELVHGYGAVGCAYDVVLGALAVTERVKPKRRVRMALEAAERHSGGVRGPMVIISGGAVDRPTVRSVA